MLAPTSWSRAAASTWKSSGILPGRVEVDHSANINSNRPNVGDGEYDQPGCICVVTEDVTFASDASVNTNDVRSAHSGAVGLCYHRASGHRGCIYLQDRQPGQLLLAQRSENTAEPG